MDKEYTDPIEARKREDATGNQLPDNDGFIDDDDIFVDADDDDDDDFEKEARWDAFIDEIIRGNVIPVIGPDLLIDKKDNPHKQLIRHFVRKYGIQSDPRTFSQLIYDRDFLNNEKIDHHRDRIYERIFKTLQKARLTPSESLMELLSTKMFPFVITTSFTGVVEDAMKQIWGDDKVRVLQFTNASTDSTTAVGSPKNDDIENENDVFRPTVFYMFGKSSPVPHRYVVSDLDMMSFCQKWISGSGIPVNIADCIRKRYLLFLGVDGYSDWLFRFIWFSMRSTANGQINNVSTNGDSLSSSMFIGNGLNNSLEKFLNRLQIVVQKEPKATIDEIVSRVNKRKARTTKILDSYDVFISYSRTDQIVANSLFDALKRKDKDLRVWMDNRGGLDIGDNWPQMISEGIKRSEIFVPVLTSSIKNEVFQLKEYRKEWQEASDKAQRLGGVPFIIPLAVNGFRFDDPVINLPKAFTDTNVVWFSSINEMDTVADRIVGKVNEKKELKKKMSNGK